MACVWKESQSDDEEFTSVFSDYDFSDSDFSDDENIVEDGKSKVGRADRRNLRFLDVYIEVNCEADGDAGKYKCTVCCKLFKTKQGCKNHLLNGHNIRDHGTAPGDSNTEVNKAKTKPKTKLNTK
ncbi:uncharacterized protein LOC102801089, partial [Saccoglossus kowalevskii]|uniref:Uncharacterized protein LOC102801089 n=1 Tax=Saccoglossus kowalevskii TaxID=10224 RepID=A0ABM0MHS8_SACKO